MVTAAIPVGMDPEGVALTPDGTKAYVANTDIGGSGPYGNTVSVIDTILNIVTGTITVGRGPRGIAASADGSTVYVANNIDGTLSVIDTQQQKVTATININGSNGFVSSAPALTPDGSTLYLASGELFVINPSNNKVIKTVTLPGLAALSVVVTPDGSQAYVACTMTHGTFGVQVVVLDTATNTVTSTIPVISGATDEPTGIAITPDGSDVYVLNGYNTPGIYVIDTSSNTVAPGAPVNGVGSVNGGFIGALAPSSVVQYGKLLGDASGRFGHNHGVVSPAAGDTIDIASGNVYYQTTDYTTAGQNSLAFVRSYNAGIHASSVPTALGANWRSQYDRYISIISSSQVMAQRADGQQINFTRIGSAWIPDSDVDLTLVNSGGTWTLTDHDDTVESYGQGNVCCSFASLFSITFRNGYEQDLEYAFGNCLESVTDSYNRSLSFTCNSDGTIAAVTTPDGTTLNYGYYSIGPSPQLAAVTYPTAPSTSQSYSYNSGLLTGITDENGNAYASWSYNQLGQGLSSQLGTGANFTAVRYNSGGSATVTSPLGVNDTYSFTGLQGIPKVTRITRAATATTAAASELFAYDGNGYTSSRTDWNGNTTTYVNDAHGDPTTIVEAVGRAEARTTTIAYDSVFVHLPHTVATPGLSASYVYASHVNNNNISLLAAVTKTLTDTTTSTMPYATGGQTRTWAYTWNPNFLLASVQTPGTAFLLKYDGSGALTSVIDALGTSTITAHTPGGLPTTIIDVNGVTTNWVYSPRQWPLSSTIHTSGGLLTTSWIYDAAGNLTNTTLPDHSSLSEAYDTAHRIIGISDALGNAINYTLDALGDRTLSKTSNAVGTVQRQHSASFDALGRLLKDIGGAGQTTGYSFDPNGKV